MEEKKILLSELFNDMPLSITSVRIDTDNCALVEFSISEDKKEWAYIAPAYICQDISKYMSDAIISDLMLVERIDDKSGEIVYYWNEAISDKTRLSLFGEVYTGGIPFAQKLHLSDTILNGGRFGEGTDRDRWIDLLKKRYEAR